LRRRIRGKIGEVKFSESGVIRVPKSVARFFLLKPGDNLEFYPPETDFTVEETENLMAILIRRATATVALMER